MQIYVIISLIFIATTLISFVVIWLLARKANPLAKRLNQEDNLLGTKDLAKNPLSQSAAAKTKMKPNLERVVSALGQLSPNNEQYNSKLRLTLMQGGIYKESAIRILFSLKILGALTFCIIAVLLSTLARQSGISVIFVSIVMALAGYILPTIILTGKIRRRQNDIALGLPDALDFLVICVEAGLGLNSALIRVGQEIRMTSKALSEELVFVNQEMRTGMSRAEALRHLCDRNRIDDLRILVGALILAEKMGTNIADTLRAQSDSLRTKVRQRLEEKAAKTAIKLLFPLVFFILPALFIVIMGPGIILMLKAVGPILH
jgi:tight adherence protein C